VIPRLDGRRVAITGGHGALGTRLVDLLTAAGAADISVIDTRPGRAHPAVRQTIGSVIDRGVLAPALAGCDVLVHLAAWTAVDGCDADPFGCMQVNVAGTAAVLDACVHAAVPRVLFASTAHVYGATHRQPISEDQPLRPESVYACSKAAAEQVVRAWTCGPHRVATILRFSNIYGPRMSEETVIGRVCRQVADGGPVRVRSFTPVRDFLFLDDAAEALVRLMAADPGALRLEIFNVSTGVGHTIAAVVDEARAQAASLGGRSPVPVEVGMPAPGPPSTIVLDAGALARRLAWHPATPLRTGLRRTLQHLMSGES
jgi:nucleoside-diphosphate-sugar epimerase